MFRRVARMAFAPGMHVFPGGSVDPADARPRRVPSPARRSPRTAAGRGRGSAGDLRGVRGAAGRGRRRYGSGRRSASLARAGRSAGSGWLPASSRWRTLLADAGLAVRAADLRPWARWVTPPFENRRFDTRFFVPPCPPGSRRATSAARASGAAWLSPAAAVAAHARRRAADAAADAGVPGGARRGAGRRRRCWRTPRGVAPGLAVGRAGRRTARSCSGSTSTAAAAGSPRGVNRRQAWAGGDVTPVGALRARPEPGPDDAGRHQHLGARRPGRRARRRRRPRPGRRRAPARRAGRRRGAAAPGSAPCCSPTGTSTTARGRARFARARPGSASAPSTRRSGSGRRGWPAGTSSTSTACVVEVVATPGHTGDSLSLRAAGGRGAAHRRHRARPRNDGRGPPGRPAGRLPRLAAPARGARRRARRSRDRAARPRARRCADPLGRRPRSTCRTGPSGSSRCARRWRRARRTPRDVVERVYADVPARVWPAAELSVRAQLEYLRVSSLIMQTGPTMADCMIGPVCMISGLI